MRCPDCGKFVGLDNGDPEVNNIEAEWNACADGAEGSFLVRADVRATRNCADCGQELKGTDLSMEAEVPLSDMDGWSALTDAEKLEIGTQLNEGSLDPDVSDGGSSEDGGGGRYAKNMITTSLNYTLTLKTKLASGKDVELTHSGELSDEVAASGYDESV